MLDIQTIRTSPDEVRRAIEVKRVGAVDLVDRILQLDAERRAAVTELQEAQTRARTLSREIGALIQSGQPGEADERKRQSTFLRESARRLEERARELEEELVLLQLEVPNIPHPSVPEGFSPDENEVVREVGMLPRFDFEPAPHWDLAARHQIVDFDRGARVSGAGFPFYIGAGARLQRALVNFFLETAITEGGYTEIQPPVLVNAASATGTGQLPDKEDLMYEVQRDALYLVPTAEVPVTNFLRDEILPESALPMTFCAYTPCFRREAGSYGKDVRGLNRLHQFDKVELVQFVHPDTSYDALERMLSDVERLLVALNLPYRCLLMCTGEMGFTQSKKYDLEVWSAAQQRWLEVSSISNFEAFQARRANIRFRPADQQKPQYLHTLNGSGLALPRVVAALMENNQDADARIAIPEVLRPYTGFDHIG